MNSNEFYKNYAADKIEAFQSSELMIKSIEQELSALSEEIPEMETAYSKMEYRGIRFPKLFGRQVFRNGCRIGEYTIKKYLPE